VGRLARVSLVAGANMADEEVLPYCPCRKSEGAPVLYWMAYRHGKHGGYAGTTVVEAMIPVFTAGSEERLKEIAHELGYELQRDALPSEGARAG
jgi:hypothetical protein